MAGELTLDLIRKREEILSELKTSSFSVSHLGNSYVVKNFLNLLSCDYLKELYIYNVMTHFRKTERTKKVGSITSRYSDADQTRQSGGNWAYTKNGARIDKPIRQFSNLIPIASGKEISFNRARYWGWSANHLCFVLFSEASGPIWKLLHRKWSVIKKTSKHRRTKAYLNVK